MNTEDSLMEKEIVASFSLYELYETKEVHIYGGFFSESGAGVVNKFPLCEKPIDKFKNRINILRLCLRQENFLEVLDNYKERVCGHCIDQFNI